MKINLSKLDQDKVIKLLETKEENISIASMLNDLCFSLDSFQELKNTEEKDKEDKCKEIFLEYFELDETNQENIDIVNRSLSNTFKETDLTEYENNPYKKALNIKETIQKPYKLHYLSYPAYSFFPINDISVDPNDYYREHSEISYASREYNYLTLSKNNNIWMCITPNEINTMKNHIDKAKGNVITFGLGLGYYAFMTSNKKEVKKVTIIERDNNIINLFKDNILPLFPYKDKIEIISTDAYEFINKNKLMNYDYAFFDLWHNAEDGLPIYIELLNKHIKCETGYWIEESIIALYRRCLLTVIEESLNGYTDDDYRKSKNAIDKAINTIYFKTKSLHINSYNEIHKLLTNESIKELITK